ncbi:molybdopterin-dependent oxidoreductase [Halocynthiibacter styelae]|uniref:Molybdopterin-dependent oxidoreductase n=1 Tax=Halocynthiibacter styelae TaxID=2761955 RepID=A0A8J7IS48_9RHOB|nr:molybdopterin-dependent oxidoreductase [Paenihalocynthiibacter styelae]MBI1494526.1 molybdopterin-dependent oxidoreductase [Paenihalocynthiibacter styelae]
MNRIFRVISTILAISAANVAFAGDVILTVSGKVTTSTDSNLWEFDRAALEALPTSMIRTTTIWTDGPQVFEGVSLAVLLDHVGVEGGTILAVALNDYAVKIPTTDAIEDGPIIAYQRNDAPLSVRDRGPLWIIYPFDDNEIYRSEEYYSRSIWQLDRIVIED